MNYILYNVDAGGITHWEPVKLYTNLYKYGNGESVNTDHYSRVISEKDFLDGNLKNAFHVNNGLKVYGGKKNKRSKRNLRKRKNKTLRKRK